MKILYYSPHPHLRLDAPTGYGTHMREMIAAWRRMGVEVKTLIAGDRSGASYGSQAQRPGKGGIKKLVPSLVWETLKDMSLVRFDGILEKELRKTVEEFAPDMIYERVAYLQNSGVRVARSSGTRHVAEINAPYPEERVAFSGRSLMLRTARNNEREVLVHSDCISVVSSALRDHFTRILPEAEEKITVVPNCVNPEVVSHDTARVEELREKYGLKGCFVIGFVGSIFPYHGVDILIEAFSKPGAENAKLLIVGDGAMIPELKALCNRLGIFRDVVFTGSIPHREVYPFIEIMDICCMAKSNWYGSPVKIFEYGLLKKPVIAPDVAPVRDVMTDEDGLIIEARVEAFHNALKKLTNDRQLRNRLAENWHRKVLLKHTWDTAAKEILSKCT